MTESSAAGAPVAFHYSGHGPNASIGVAICHGFTGSPLSVLPWAEHLAGQGFAVSVPLLPGHGTDWLDLAGSRWQEWYGTFERAYLELAATTTNCFAAGLSMGGAVALRLASEHDVPGLVLVNPGLSFYDRRVRFVGILKRFMPTTSPLQEENPTAASTDDGDYSRTPLAAVHELRKLFRATARALPRVVAPTLVFSSAVDAVVPPSSLSTLKRRIGSAEFRLVDLPASGHVATLDVEASRIFAESTAFFQHAADGVASRTS